MGDPFAPAAKIHMRDENTDGDKPLCGYNFKATYSVVEDWALVNCQGCQKKRILRALRKAGFNPLEIAQAAAEHLGVEY